MASAADIELAFYERFLIERGIEPYPVQERAFEHVFAGDGVLVTVPTGTGKTLIAQAALFKALALGQTAVYTTPLRALTEEKYRELKEAFGADNVGFATGDFQENRDAPIQVEVAEILWNRIFSSRGQPPADVVVLDEGHYFNDPERGYVWEQTIIGLHPSVQLVILSATIGRADAFCHWVELTRRAPMHLVESRERMVPLEHRYREQYLIEVVRELAAAGDTPAIVFTFGRERCFDNARLLKSCSRFTSDDERERIAQLADEVLWDRGAAAELRPLLLHGIGVHHAGVLPRYKQLVETLALERLVKFVVSTETISAGINLPAKAVVFPELRKFVGGKARLLSPAEYHQMAGRAGRPQFDDKGIAIALAPDAVVQEIRKEIKTAKKRGYRVDEAQIRQAVYAKARADAQRRKDVTWSEAAHRALVEGEPAALVSRTRITAETVLAIGLPDLEREQLPGEAVDLAEAEARPAYEHLNIRTVVDHLLLPERDRREAHKRLAQVTANLRALGVVDEHGRQVAGEMIGKLPGIDGLFVYYAFMHRDFSYEQARELVEFLVDHDVIQRALDRKELEKRREWIRAKLREMRAEQPQATWEDAEAEYEREHPRELSETEQLHHAFLAELPHPELHGGKVQKTVWAQLEDDELSFFDFVERHRLEHEEGSLFSYLIRVLRVAHAIAEATGVGAFESIEQRVRDVLAAVDARLVRSL